MNKVAVHGAKPPEKRASFLSVASRRPAWKQHQSHQKALHIVVVVRVPATGSASAVLRASTGKASGTQPVKLNLWRTTSFSFPFCQY